MSSETITTSSSTSAISPSGPDAVPDHTSLQGESLSPTRKPTLPGVRSLRAVGRALRAISAIAVFLGAWQIAPTVGWVDRVFLPPLSEVLVAWWELARSGDLWINVQASLQLNIARPPQGRPLLVQAGSSEAGKEYAARYAEAVFTAQQTLADGQQFYADLKGRLGRHGRTPDQVVTLPGICAVIGGTQAEAEAKEAELNDLISPEYGQEQLSRMLEHDITAHPLDGPLPTLPGEAAINGHKSRFTLVTELARRERLTIRQLIQRLAGGRGHRVFAGTPEQVADEIELWFTSGAADGFNIMPPLLPGGLEDFVEQVVPELRRRGLFRTEYTGHTLRQHYGLERPTNRYQEMEFAS